MRETAATLREGWIDEVEILDEASSTNDLALAAPMRGTRLLWARVQTGGRGRGSNRWTAGPGALTFSLTLPDVGVPADRIPRLSMLCALAVADAVRGWAEPRLKWPNDVFAQDRKLAGILVELHREGGVVVGVGINVNNDVSDVAPPAINLRDAAGGGVHVEPAEVLRRWAGHFGDLLGLFRSGELRLARAWADRCWLRGRRVVFDSGVGGLCLGVADDGALRLETEEGVRSVYGGVLQEVGQ